MGNCLRNVHPAGRHRTGGDVLDAKHFFISYAHDSGDRDLCARFAAALGEAGHRVFHDQRLQVGEDWAREIERQLGLCDYFLLLLSREALNSELVLQEVERAAARRKAGGAPVLLTVRVKLEGELPYRWAAQLAPFQHRTWRGEPDFEPILRDILCLAGGERAAPPRPPPGLRRHVALAGAAALLLFCLPVIARHLDGGAPCVLVPGYAMHAVTASERHPSELSGDRACDPAHFFCVELAGAGAFALPPNGVRIGPGTSPASSQVVPASAPDGSTALAPAALALPLPRWVRGAATLCDGPAVLLKRTAPDGGFTRCANGGAFRCGLVDGVRRCDISDDGC